MPKKHNQQGQRAVIQLQGFGYFNTPELNAIGQAFYNTLERGGITADDVVEEIGAEWPDDVDSETMTAKLDEHFLDKFFWQHEAGAILVAELAAEGFKVVKER